MTEKAAKPASAPAVRGSAGAVFLTLLALVALSLAIARVVPSAAIFAAEPHEAESQGSLLVDHGTVPGIGTEPAEAQPAVAENTDWAPAFGTRPPVAPPPAVVEPEPAEVIASTPPPEPKAEPESQRHLDYWLTGHILDGDRSLAFVHDGREEQVVRAGSVLSGGEEVIAISAEGVRARYGAEDFVIVVRDDLPQQGRQSGQFQGAAAHNQANPARPVQNNNRRSFLHQGGPAQAGTAAAGRHADLDDDDWGDDEYDDDWDDWDDDDWDDDDWDD